MTINEISGLLTVVNEVFHSNRRRRSSGSVRGSTSRVDLRRSTLEMRLQEARGSTPALSSSRGTLTSKASYLKNILNNLRVWKVDTWISVWMSILPRKFYRKEIVQEVILEQVVRKN